MSNVLKYTYTTGSSERPAMNHTLAISKFTPNQTVNVIGEIKSIIYNFIFKYGGTSSPSWTGYASIVASDGTEYQGTSLTKTITKDTNINMSLTIPESNCPPASVINSNNFSIKLTTTNCSKDPYVPASSAMSIVITYSGAQSYIYSPGNAVTITSPTGFTKNSGTKATGSNSYGTWIATTNSSYSATNYPAYYMFDSDTSTSWASATGSTTGGTDTEGHPYNISSVPAILITLPKKLYNITVKITNRVPPNSSAPVAGADYVYCYGYDSSLQSLSVSDIQTYAASDYGSVTDEAWLKIDNRTNASVSENVLTCNFNNSIPYDIIGLACPAVCRSSDKYWSVGEISISGSSGYNGWIPATPYIYNGSSWVQASANIYDYGWT